MTTKQALKHLLDNQEAYQAAGITPTQAALYRYRLLNGSITQDKMVEILKRAKYTVKTQMEWVVPK